MATHQWMRRKTEVPLNIESYDHIVDDQRDYSFSARLLISLLHEKLQRFVTSGTKEY